jgi:hypothetical protein
MLTWLVRTEGAEKRPELFVSDGMMDLGWLEAVAVGAREVGALEAGAKVGALEAGAKVGALEAGACEVSFTLLRSSGFESASLEIAVAQSTIVDLSVNVP